MIEGHQERWDTLLDQNKLIDAFEEYAGWLLWHPRTSALDAAAPPDHSCSLLNLLLIPPFPIISLAQLELSVVPDPPQGCPVAGKAL